MSRKRICSVPALSTILVFGVALAAHADQFSLFGRIQLNNGTSIAQIDTGLAPMISMTGPAPQALPIPANLFSGTIMQFRVFPANPTFAQVVNTITTSLPVGATMAAGGGAGSFGFCPFPGNPVNPACTNPAQATGGRNNQIVYTAGGNQFGGTFRLLRTIRNVVSVRIATAPLQFSHRPGFRDASPWIAGVTRSLTTALAGQPGQITQSPVLGPQGSILTPGPVVGTGPFPGTSLLTGFPLTTGMVIMRDDIPERASFTLTGSDNRNPTTGLGQITLVAGGLNRATTGTESPRFTTMTFTVPEPGLGFGILAGCLVVVVGGRMRRQGRM